MEYSVDEFQYDSLPQKLSESIIEKENILNGIKHRYAKEVGKVFYEAQQEFSDYNNGGLFKKWYSSLGFKQRNVYNYIQIYNEVQQLHGDQLETFEELPKRLQLEVSKPSHIPELKEKVLDGDIKTHKEYKELERQLKQRDEQNAQLQSQVEQAQRSESIARKKLEDEQNREPEIKREVKEVIPPHVKAQLSDRQHMIDAKDKEIKQLQEQLSKAEEQKQKFEKQDYLEEDEQIASINFQVESTVLEIKDNINRFLNENASTAFREAAIARASKKTKNQIYDGVEELEAFCRTMRQSLNSNVIVGG